MRGCALGCLDILPLTSIFTASFMLIPYIIPAQKSFQVGARYCIVVAPSWHLAQGSDRSVMSRLRKRIFRDQYSTAKLNSQNTLTTPSPPLVEYLLVETPHGEATLLDFETLEGWVDKANLSCYVRTWALDRFSCPASTWK